ncbi:MAG: hypothetical protein KAH18_06490 [Psychromonas sp.]|nr:hypothetical protein [Psychromonas sp.]
MKIKILLLLCALSILLGCSDNRPEKLKSNIQHAQYLLTNLGQALDDHNVLNATLLQEYAKILSVDKPNLTPLLMQLSRDATKEGPLYDGLEKRLQTLKVRPQVLGNIDAQISESKNLIDAANPSLFNDALSDPVNVIADMSGGKLARVNSINAAQSLAANNATDNGAGSQLVGNPGYGSWQTNSSGTSFWQWYGMYAMFSALSPHRIQYGNWASHRDYSYYNDVGRNHYTSPSKMKSQDNLATKTKKQFGQRGGFKSPYAKNKTGASRMSTASQKAQKSASFARKSSFFSSRSTGSFRNSRSTNSRGIHRGK